MNYRNAMIAAVFVDWFGYIKQDAICGNGFEIFWYGLNLIFKYIVSFITRLIIALFFPISAVLILKVCRENKKLQKKLDAEIDELSI